MLIYFDKFQLELAQTILQPYFALFLLFAIFQFYCRFLTLLFALGAENGNNGILVFSTEERLKALADSSEWFADGMFGKVPDIFGQSFTIHAITPENIIPMVYVMLPNKLQRTYKRLFEILKELQVSYPRVRVRNCRT